MKKTLLLLLAASILFSLTACFNKDTSVDEVIDKKALIMGYDKNYMPMGFTEENGIYTGFDIDLAKAICKRIITPSGDQTTLNVMLVSGDDGVSGINDGSIDFLGNSMSARGDGEKNLGYSSTILTNAQVIVALKSNTAKTKNDLYGKNIAVVPNSISAEALAGDSSFKSKITVVEAVDIKTAIAELNSGKVDAVVMDEVCAKYLIAKGNELNIINENLKEDSYRLVFNKSNKALIKKVNDVLKELEADGTLEELSIKWFGENIINLK